MCRDPDQAREIMDKTEELKDLQEEIHQEIQTDVGEDDFDDLLNQMDLEIANEKVQDLPDNPNIQKMANARQRVKERRQAKSNDGEEDINSMLASL